MGKKTPPTQVFDLSSLTPAVTAEHIDALENAGKAIAICKDCGLDVGELPERIEGLKTLVQHVHQSWGAEG